MWKWINTILTTPTKFTNYDFLLSTLLQTLNDDRKYKSIRTKYFESDKSLEKTIDILKKE